MFEYKVRQLSVSVRLMRLFRRAGLPLTPDFTHSDEKNAIVLIGTGFMNEAPPLFFDYCGTNFAL